ncbi:MAG TPA: YbaB/EbfC family nucleoid-associated protein [Candidatus Faeciplasma gallinarum]|uniref:Nucleoid-associated protein IAD01_00185 n=1 Tax=Candidatus Faeciplasma gallinarum TaxID=2840799 RepID=A0A9D1EML3_9FIRM|nr:YbaB/EbfC family nucleoid-associated protein [Candidatus Faeciplasma gallinarum]
MKARLPQGMGGGPQNMNQMIRQAQKMQEEMANFQSEFEEKEFKASVGGGAVEITMNGKREVTNVSIKPEVVDPEDVEMLEDLVASAVNEVLANIETESSEGMQKITGGINMPGLF